MTTPGRKGRAGPAKTLARPTIPATARSQTLANRSPTTHVSGGVPNAVVLPMVPTAEEGDVVLRRTSRRAIAAPLGRRVAGPPMEGTIATGPAILATPDDTAVPVAIRVTRVGTPIPARPAPHGVVGLAPTTALAASRLPFHGAPTPLVSTP